MQNTGKRNKFKMREYTDNAKLFLKALWFLLVYSYMVRKVSIFLAENLDEWGAIMHTGVEKVYFVDVQVVSQLYSSTG